MCCGSEIISYGYQTSILDLPIANLHQICSYLSVRDLLSLEAACASFATVVAESFLDYRVLEIAEETGTAVQQIVSWAATRRKINNLACFRASGKICALIFEQCIRPIIKELTLWPHLEHLHLTYCRGLKDSHVLMLTRLWPRLSTLNLAGCVNLSDAAVRYVADNIKQVKHFDCSNWMYITDDSIGYLARKHPDLASISLDGCARVTSSSIVSLVQSCPQLHTLSVANCYRICDAALATLGTHDSIMTINLRQCPKVSSIQFLATCPSLTSLDLSGCPFITDTNMHLLLRLAGHRLHQLTLHSCTSLTGAALTSIASYCPNLRTLDLSRIDISDQDLLPISEGCHDIRQLTLDWCSQLCDRSLIPIVHSNPHIHSLSMEGVYNTTDLFLAALAKHALHLEALNVRMCVQLTTTGIVKLARVAKLRVIHLAGIMNDSSTLYLASELKRYSPSCQLCY